MLCGNLKLGLGILGGAFEFRDVSGVFVVSVCVCVCLGACVCFRVCVWVHFVEHRHHKKFISSLYRFYCACFVCFFFFVLFWFFDFPYLVSLCVVVCVLVCVSCVCREFGVVCGCVT